jgi:hypothetical protein
VPPAQSSLNLNSNTYCSIIMSPISSGTAVDSERRKVRCRRTAKWVKMRNSTNGPRIVLAGNTEIACLIPGTLYAIAADSVNGPHPAFPTMRATKSTIPPLDEISFQAQRSRDTVELQEQTTSVVD